MSGPNADRRILKRPRKVLGRRPRGALHLLLALIVLSHIYPMGTLGPKYAIAFQLAFMSMLVSSLWVAISNRWALLLVGSVGMTSLVLTIVNQASGPNTPGLQVAALVAVIAFQLTIIYSLTAYVFTGRRVTWDTIYAAAVVYILVAACYSAVFTIIETLSPGSYVNVLRPEVPVHWWDLIGFSYVTLTTLGYGDIIPTHTLARAVAAFEAVFGVLYTAILMARLVGLHGRDHEA